MLTNGGMISALSDKLVGNNPGSPGTIEIDNFSTMTGFWDLAGATDSVVTNAAGAHLALRHFADTDGDGVRDTQRVAISDFGNGTTSMILSSGSLLSLAPVSSPATVDATDYYVAANLDPTFYDFTRPNITQAQMLNLDLFSHTGVIDLRGLEVGNSLVMTGAASVAGGPGAGVYRADGGTLLINSTLNTGQVPGGFTGSESDVLVVDRTELGTRATQILVDRRTGLSGETPGNGILVVEVRDKSAGASDPGVFTLRADRVLNGQAFIYGGIHAYALHQNGVDADPADGNWYLRSAGFSPNPGIYENTTSILRPVIEMPVLRSSLGGRIMNSSTHFERPNEAIDDRPNFWMRGTSLYREQSPVSGTFGQDFDTRYSEVEAGIDMPLLRTEHGEVAGGLSVHMGSFGGSTEFASLQGSTLGFGAAASYTDDNGFYFGGMGKISKLTVDFHSSFNGELASNMDGFAGAISGEVGHIFQLDDNWSIIPQAQLTYGSIELDRFTDSLGADVTFGLRETLLGRLGIYAQYAATFDDGAALKAYVGANYYHDFTPAHAVDASGLRLASETSSDAVGIAVGAGYTLPDQSLRVFGELSARTSVGNFGDSMDVRGMAGFKLSF